MFEKLTPRVGLALSVAVASLAAIAVLGCGDDSSSPEGTLSKEVFIERADAICQRLYDQRDPLEIEAARAGQAGDAARAAEVFDNAAEITDNRFEELRELTPPEGDEDTVNEIWDDGQGTADPARDAADALRDQDAKALAAASAEGGRSSSHFSKQAIDYGFFVCGRGASVEVG